MVERSEFFDISSIPAVINQNRCLHCGRCQEICPVNAIEKI
ncbi:MAG: 4Fe-4S binding protein [Lachnospiraceae bacterium]|nr:4Fe-4S binding protein [Lachnospiraceae bacterium]